MLSTMERRTHGPIGDDRATGIDNDPHQGSSSSSAGGGSASSKTGEGVSFWSSLSVVDSLFSDDPPFRLGQTMSADHASAFSGSSGGSLFGGFHHHLQPQQPAERQQHGQHLLHGGSHGAIGLQRSSFDEGGFYGSSSLFSTSSPILSPPASPALHYSLYSSEEDQLQQLPPSQLGHHQQHHHHGGRSQQSHLGGLHQQQQQQAPIGTPSGLHIPIGGGGGGGGNFHSNGLHSTNGVTTRKHNYAVYANGHSSNAVGAAASKYSNPRPGSSGLPNGAGHKHPNGGGGIYNGGASGQQGGLYGGYGGGHHHHQGGSGLIRGSPPRSQPIHAPQRSASSLVGTIGGSGGYPASPPARLRNGGLGSMPRSSPPQRGHQQPQQHSYLSTALKSSSSNAGGGAASSSHLHGSGSSHHLKHQHQHYGGGSQIGIPSSSLNLYPTDGNNICYDDEAPAGLLGGSSSAGILSSSPLLHGSGSQPIQIARGHHHHQQGGSLGGSMGHRSASSLQVVGASPSTVAAALSLSGQLNIGSLRINDDLLAAETSPLLQLPSTTLLRIFGFLAASDLARLEQVCKRRLSYLANDDGLWKELYLRRYKLLELTPGVDPATGAAAIQLAQQQQQQNDNNNKDGSDEDSENSSDEWAWIYSLLQQNERWKDIFKTRYSAEQWRIGSLKMFNGCWGFISQTPAPGQLPEQTLDIFFHRKDIAPDGEWYEDWWLKDTPGVSRSQKCGYWDTFLCGRIVRYKQRAAYAQGRRPQACNISFVGEERRDPITGEPLPALHDAKIAQRSLAAARFG